MKKVYHEHFVTSESEVLINSLEIIRKALKEGAFTKEQYDIMYIHLCNHIRETFSKLEEFKHLSENAISVNTNKDKTEIGIFVFPIKSDGIVREVKFDENGDWYVEVEDDEQ